MRKRLFAAALVPAVVAPLALATSSHADPPTTPNGPWPAANEQNLNAIHSYDQLWDTLESIEHRSRGAVELEPAPLQSNTGRDIPVVTIGDGPVPVMFIANLLVVGTEAEPMRFRNNSLLTDELFGGLDGFAHPVFSLG